MTPEEEQELLASMGDYDPKRAALDHLSGGGQIIEPSSQDEIRAQYMGGDNIVDEQPSPTPQPRLPVQQEQISPQPQAAPQQAPAQPQFREAEDEGGFDWGRALTAFGNGDVAAYDARRSERRNGPALREQRRLKMGDEAAEREARLQAGTSARARLDAASPESRMAQDDYIAQLQSWAAIPGVPKGIADQLAANAETARTMSAAHIDRSIPQMQSLIGMALKGAGVSQKADQRAEDVDLKKQQIKATIGDRAVGRALQREGMVAAADERELRRQERQDEHDKPPVSELDKHMQRKTALDEIDEIESLLPKVRYTGAGASTINQVSSLVPDAMDPRNDAERKVSTLLGRLRAPERKDLFGAALSKYDIKDSDAFMAGLQNNPKQLKENLSTLRKALKTSTDVATAVYPGIGKIDAKISAAHGQPLLKTPPGAKAGDRYPNKKDGKIYEVQPDGTMKAVK